MDFGFGCQLGCHHVECVAGVCKMAIVSGSVILTDAENSVSERFKLCRVG